MEPGPVSFFFDYLDPLSYLIHVELGGPGDATGFDGARIRYVPLELRPPPAPLLDPDSEPWLARWREATAAGDALGVRLSRPGILPWTRKAHELSFHALEKGVGPAVHDALFEAVFVRGDDVGRVDVLVGLARRLGLDATEARAVLDVDRFADLVAALRAESVAAGVSAPPALGCGGRLLQGFHNRGTLRTFLHR
jgi:predicted DsbA family dithiol-disulfide isomerase